MIQTTTTAARQGKKPNLQQAFDKPLIKPA